MLKELSREKLMNYVLNREAIKIILIVGLIKRT